MVYMKLSGSRLALTNPIYWLWLATWPVLLSMGVIACLREETPWRLVPLAVIAAAGVFYVVSVIRFARPLVLLNGTQLVLLGRHDSYEIDTREVKHVDVTEAGDPWLSFFMPRCDPYLRCLLIEKHDGDFVVFTDLIGTPAPTRRLAGQLRDHIDLAHP